ncbi:ATP-binding protein [Streptomyces sp. SM1]|uniref:ATP-binding protein n=1 Tax=Streptomyces sp. SM1 TaxID=402229 RepID=UPI0027E49D95|nr:ATP-binding protein [Streptomyces sp. SM1]
MEFTARPEEVGVLRRIVQRRLAAWGLDELVDAAQLCVSELVSNVVTHVGHGTPGSLTVFLTGTHLRIEVQDPDPRVLPTLVTTDVDAEGGRGMALVEALTDRWGVQLHGDRKVTWCELATGPASPISYAEEPSVTRAEALLDVYATMKPPVCSYSHEFGKVGRLAAEQSVIDIITRA